MWRSVVGKPKGKAGKGLIPVVPRLRHLLNQQKKASGYILPGRKPDTALNLDELAMDVIRPTLSAHGITWHGWHAFRRGLATNLKQLGVDDLTIQAILRHSDVSVTRRAYIKTVPTDSDDAMNALENVFKTREKAMAAQA